MSGVNELAVYLCHLSVKVSKSLCFHRQNIPSGAIIILHACAHNPTGVDPSVSF